MNTSIENVRNELAIAATRIGPNGCGQIEYATLVDMQLALNAHLTSREAKGEAVSHADLIERARAEGVKFANKQGGEEFDEWAYTPGNLTDGNDGYLPKSVWEACMKAYDEGVSSQEAAKPVGVPEGYVLVPVEPTDEMFAAYQEEMCHWSAMTHVDDDGVYALWKAMLAATQDGDRHE